jgi:hypothetical protein
VRGMSQSAERLPQATCLPIRMLQGFETALLECAAPPHQHIAADIQAQCLAAEDCGERCGGPACPSFTR